MDIEILLNLEQDRHEAKRVILRIILLEVACHSLAKQVQCEDFLDLLNSFFLKDQIVADKDGADELLKGVCLALLNERPVKIFLFEFQFHDLYHLFELGMQTRILEETIEYPMLFFIVFSKLSHLHGTDFQRLFIRLLGSNATSVFSFDELEMPFGVATFSDGPVALQVGVLDVCDYSKS